MQLLHAKMIKWFVPFVKITVFYLLFVCVREIHKRLHECMLFDLRWILYENIRVTKHATSGKLNAGQRIVENIFSSN